MIQADDFYSVLSHPMRLRAVMLLQSQAVTMALENNSSEASTGQAELCVCELMHALSEQQPVVSRHLSQLKAAGLLSSRKQGQWVYYRIHNELPDWMAEVLTNTFSGIQKLSPYSHDIQRLSAMQDRPSQACG